MGKHTSKKDFLFGGTTVHAARKTEVKNFNFLCNQRQELIDKAKKEEEEEAKKRFDISLIFNEENININDLF